MNWITQFKYNPIDLLLFSNNPALIYFVKRDLLNEKVDSINTIINLTPVQVILKKQLTDGYWKSPNSNQKKNIVTNYKLIETWKQFRYLVEKYGLDNTFKPVEKAAEFIFSCQSSEGDIRGMLGNQYAIYYTGALMSLLIQAGYQDDPRIEKGFRWLISMRQSDGGWLGTNLGTLDLPYKEFIRLITQDVETLKAHNISKPSSHNWTGMVIRAFASHPKYRHVPEAIQAAYLLKQAFFSEDKNYTSYKDAEYWVKFQFPFWWNNLVAVMDSLSRMNISREDQDIQKALKWFIENQQKSGLWLLSYGKKHPITYNPKAKEEQLWVSYVICRIFKSFYQKIKNKTQLL